jgi:hypothetical protein
VKFNTYGPVNDQINIGAVRWQRLQRDIDAMRKILAEDEKKYAEKPTTEALTYLKLERWSVEAAERNFENFNEHIATYAAENTETQEPV